MSDLTWYGAEVYSAVQRALVNGMNAAGELLVTEAEHLLATPYPPASAPGQPPHRRSGDLQSSQTHVVERAGTDVVLHVGVAASAPAAAYARPVHNTRPWLPEAVDNARAIVLDTIARHLVRALS